MAKTSEKNSSKPSKFLIHGYGLFWDADEVDWFPGQGTPFRLLGRFGQNKNKLQVIDARYQKGIYILYGNYGPHYVGLVKGQALGDRLKQHLNDKHQNKWTRFSWFGFRKDLKGTDENGFSNLADVPRTKNISPEMVIRDLEAVLIKAMGLSNINKMKIAGAKEWKQITQIEQERYYTKLNA